MAPTLQDSLVKEKCGFSFNINNKLLAKTTRLLLKRTEESSTETFDNPVIKRF